MSSAVRSLSAHQAPPSPQKMLHLSPGGGFEAGLCGVRIKAGHSPQSRLLNQIGHVMHSPDNVVDVLSVPIANTAYEDSTESGHHSAALSTRFGFAAEQFVLNKFAKEPSEILQVSINWWKEWWAWRKTLWRCRIAIRSRHVHTMVRSCFCHWTHLIAARKDWWKKFTRVVRWRARKVQVWALRSWRQSVSFATSRAAVHMMAIRFRARTLISITLTLWKASTEEARMRRAAFAQGVKTLKAVLEAQLAGAAFEAWNRELVAPVRCARLFADLVETRKRKRVFHLVRACQLLSVTLMSETDMFPEQVLCALAQNVQEGEDHKARQQHVDAFRLQLQSEKSRAVLKEWVALLVHLRTVEANVAAESVRIRVQQVWKRLELSCEGVEAALDRKWSDRTSRQRQTALAWRGVAGFALFHQICGRRRRALDAGVARVTEGLKRRGLRCWVLVSRSAKEEQRAGLRADRHRSRTCLGTAVREWRLCVVTQRERDLTREQADYWFERRVCLRVLRSLQAETRGRRQLVAKGRIAARHRYRRQLALSFRVWGSGEGERGWSRWEFASFVAARRAERAMLLEAQELRGRLVGRRVLACVRAAVEEGRAKREARRGLREAEERRRTEVCFWNWIAAIGAREHSAQCKMVASEHWRARGLRGAWESMRAYAAERAVREEARRRRLEGLVQALEQSKAQRLWDAWQEAHAYLTMQRFACVRARSFRDSKLMGGGWARLCEHVQCRRARACVQRRAEEHRQTQLQRRVVAAWVGAREEGVAERAREARVREGRRRRVWGEHLADWRWYVERRKSKVQREKAAVEERRVWLLREGAGRMARAGLGSMQRRSRALALSRCHSHARSLPKSRACCCARGSCARRRARRV